MHIGRSVVEMVNNDSHDELDAVKTYNAAISLAREIEDQGTVDLLTKILKMEEGHVDWAEKQQAQIKQVGLENYLLTQIDNA
jgi:bacterioferritin